MGMPMAKPSDEGTGTARGLRSDRRAAGHHRRGAKLLGDKSTRGHPGTVEQADDLRFDRDLTGRRSRRRAAGHRERPSTAARPGRARLARVLEEVGRRTARAALASLALGRCNWRGGGPARSELDHPAWRGGGHHRGDLPVVEPLGDALGRRRGPRTGAGGRRLVARRGADERAGGPRGRPGDRARGDAARERRDRAVPRARSSAEGVSRDRQDTTTGTPEPASPSPACLGADALLGPVDGEGATLRWLVEHAVVATCSGDVGRGGRGRAHHRRYVVREQFGRAIATFQAVGQRAADAYVDAQAIRLTMLQAAWRLAAGFPADAGGGGQVLRRARPAGRARGPTSTRAWASTATTRCTATSCWPSSSSCFWAATRQLVSLGGILAAEGAPR